MSFKALTTAVLDKFGRQILTVQKHSPVLLFGVGVVGVVTGVVLASRATLKLEEVLEKTQGDLEVAKTIESLDYSDSDRQKDLVLLYIKAGVDIAKLYAPAIAVLGVSIAALTGSHVILTRRNTALVAAYAALDKGFKEYRKRVIDKVGEDKERELHYGVEAREVSEVAPDGTVSKRNVRTYDPNGYSQYARVFDQNNANFEKTPEYNLVFLRAQQNYANERLRARGHLFLNEVYESLGMDQSRAGAVVGWILSKDKDADNFVDFGIFDAKKPGARDFVNGREGAIFLDFNVDGVMFDKLKN